MKKKIGRQPLKLFLHTMFYSTLHSIAVHDNWFHRYKWKGSYAFCEPPPLGMILKPPFPPCIRTKLMLPLHIYGVRLFCMSDVCLLYV